jgi:hypothetical protein
LDSKTYMLGPERVQYQTLKVALDLMGSTLSNWLGVIVEYHH